MSHYSLKVAFSRNLEVITTLMNLTVFVSTQMFFDFCYLVLEVRRQKLRKIHFCLTSELIYCNTVTLMKSRHKSLQVR
jgi:hypothetical protein